jgi:hypothetical protein
MDEVKFRDSDNRLVNLSTPAGGADSYHIYIDGNLLCYKGEWIGHLNNNDLTSDDIQILGSIIDMKK